MKKAHENFSADQLDQVINMFNDGKTQKEIADALGSSRRTIGKVLKHLGLNRSTSEAAYIKNRSKLDDPKTVEEIKKLRNSHSLEEMAVIYDSSISSIQRLCKNYDIKLKSNEYAKLQSKRMVDAWDDDKKKEASIRAKLILKENPEILEKISKLSSELWKDEEYILKQIENRKKQLGSNFESSIEKTLYSFLDDLNIKYEKQYFVGPYAFDCFIPSHDLLIECQGDYWHSLPKGERNDKSKATYIKRYFPNLTIRYFWEHEFKCVEKIFSQLKSILNIDTEQIDFDFNECEIELLNFDEVKSFVEKYHYAGKIGNSIIKVGCFLDSKLIAVCVYGHITRKESADRLSLSSSELKELTRFCIHPQYHKKNFATWFLARCEKILKKENKNIKCLISFADTTFNHNGTIYKANNWILDGEVKPSYWYVDKDGWVMHKKTLWNHAKKMSMSEKDFANQKGYEKVWGKKKYRFLKWL